MSGYYLFFRLCSNLNSTFPAKELDEVRDEDLPKALEVLAQGYLKEHPDAAATAEEMTQLFTLTDGSTEPWEVDMDELHWEFNEFRRELGIHPHQPLFLRVAPLAGWGWPLPQPMFGGQAVSDRCFFARAPDRTIAESALEVIRRLAARSFEHDWMRPHFGCCAESGFTKEERVTIEIAYDQFDLWSDTPPFVQASRHVLAKVTEIAARCEEKLPKAKRQRKRRAPKPRKPRPLTPTQTETIQVVGECRGNIAKAAKQLGKDRKTVEESYKAGMEKLGKEVYKRGTRKLARDRRGQADLADGDDRRLQ